ncbi:MAG: LysE family translocator [Roseibium sp.]|uniref:LysE family translocator n=1 Tax=Roseibium sp. TaxID=1936156 RepID=UPI0026218D25|nr:LysE family translocator [Roseibium sp.]MCV0425807.1 LysE family translocator [Roseibium sp.]
MTFENWLTFVAASLVLTMTPGPSVLLGMVHSLNFGTRKTLFTALGDISANLIQMLLVALGLGVVIANSEFAFQVIKWGGVLVLVYMSLRLWRSTPELEVASLEGSDAHPARLFASGFLVAIGNPKALVFFTAFFPQFLDPSTNLAKQLLAMCPTMAALDFSFVMLYAVGAKGLLGFLHSHPKLLNRVSGAALMSAAGFMGLVARSQ